MIVNRHLIHILSGLFCIIVPLIIVYIEPDIETKETLCISKRFFGLTCPGCGLFKSFIFAYKGEFLKSIQYHPLGVVLLLIVIYATSLGIYDYFRGTDKWMKFADSLLFWKSFAILFFVVYFVRILKGW